MKNQLAVLLVSGLSLLPSRTHGQGILNGGFELYSPDSQFLVGWHAKSGAGKDYGEIVGGVSGSQLENNRIQPKGQFASIYGPAPFLNGLPVDSYWFFGQGPATTAEQSFTVPLEARSLEFRAFNGGPGGISVQIDGVQQTSYLKAIITPGGFYGRVAEWAVDMTPYVGRDVALTFYIEPSGAGFDDVRISTELVPEPGVMALVALSSVALLAALRNRTSST